MGEIRRHHCHRLVLVPNSFTAMTASEQSINHSRFRWISSTLVPYLYGVSTRDSCMKSLFWEGFFFSQIDVVKQHWCQQHLQISDCFTVISSPNKEFIARNENIHPDISTQNHHHKNFSSKWNVRHFAWKDLCLRKDCYWTIKNCR